LKYIWLDFKLTFIFKINIILLIILYLADYFYIYYYINKILYLIKIYYNLFKNKDSFIYSTLFNNTIVYY